MEKFQEYCRSHGSSWPHNRLFNWFALESANATADASNTTIGERAFVYIVATTCYSSQQITVKEMSEALDRVSRCRDCILDLTTCAEQFIDLNSKIKSIPAAILYAATAYQRGRTSPSGGIDMERIKGILEKALENYQSSRNEKCLHSLIQYQHADVVNYLIGKNPNWSICNVEGCAPLQIANNKSSREIYRILNPERIPRLLKRGGCEEKKKKLKTLEKTDTQFDLAEAYRVAFHEATDDLAPLAKKRFKSFSKKSVDSTLPNGPSSNIAKTALKGSSTGAIDATYSYSVHGAHTCVDWTLNQLKKK